MPVSKKQYFTLTENHIKLIRSLYFEDYGEGPTVDTKRPYGNSDIEKDIVEILELPTIVDRYGEKSFTEETAKEVIKIHKEIAKALQIVCALGTFKAGTYKQIDKYDCRSWEKVGV